MELYRKVIIKSEDYERGEEIEKAAEAHALFLGHGGKYNINIAKQISFMQGAKWHREYIKTK